MKANDFTSRILPLKDNLYRVSYRITHDAGQSKQIVQEVMLRVWDQRTHLDVIDNLPAYCMVVARNMSLQKKAELSACKDLFLVG